MITKIDTKLIEEATEVIKQLQEINESYINMLNEKDKIIEEKTEMILELLEVVNDLVGGQ